MTANVPFMITNAMRSQLQAAGYSDPEIDNMTPGQAWNLPVWLEAQGGRFCMVTPWDDKHDSPGKKPIGSGWQDKPLTWAQVKPHVNHGGNIGLICGQHSGGLILLDIDENLPGFISSFPQFEAYPRIERGHPEKGKFIIRLTDEYNGQKKFKKSPQDKHPILEVLATGNQGVIPPSIHPEGGRYEFINPGAEIPTMTPQALATIAAGWQDLQAPAPVDWPPVPDRSASDNGHGPDLREAARAAWPPLKVFEHFGMTSNGTKKEGEFTRILGNGGLFVNNNGLTWALTGSGKGWGGDCFDAWHYCETNGQTGKIPPAEFRPTLLKMATAAGIAMPTAGKRAAAPEPNGWPPEPELTGNLAPGAQAAGPDNLLARCLSRGETGDSELFSALYSDRIKYDWTEKQFYSWQGSCWAPAGPGEVVRLVHTLAEKYLAKGTELVKAGDEKAKPYLSRASHLLALKRINNVLTLAQHQQKIGLTGKEWDISPMILPVKNGLIDLQAGTFRETTPADYIRIFAPVEWRGLNEPAPLWDKTLLEIFSNDPNLVNFARRLIGYMITGLIKEQIVAMFYGSGSNGKSLFVDILAAVLGESFVFPTQAEAIMDTNFRDSNAATPYVYKMRGKRVVLASEGREGQKLNTGLVKQLTGDRQITARPLNGNPVTFDQTHKIILITNHLPNITDGAEDYAIWRRVLPLPFDLQFVEKPAMPNERKINKDLPELLKKEYSGILAWCIRGCLEWQAQGLAAPAKVTNALDRYKEAEDPIAQFLEEQATLDPNGQALLKDIHAKYKIWCIGYNYTPMTEKALSARLKRKFGDPTRKTAGMCFKGFTL